MKVRRGVKPLQPTLFSVCKHDLPIINNGKVVVNDILIMPFVVYIVDI